MMRFLQVISVASVVSGMAVMSGVSGMSVMSGILTFVYRYRRLFLSIFIIISCDQHLTRSIVVSASIITLLSRYYHVIITLLSHYYHVIITSLSHYYHIIITLFYWLYPLYYLSQDRCTALFRAAERGLADTVRILVEGGADVNLLSKVCPLSVYCVCCPCTESAV